MKKKYTIFRINVSGYQKKNFTKREKSRLESLKQFTYIDHQSSSLEDILNKKNDEIILISNTDTPFAKYKHLNFSRVKLIIHPNSGYDNFPVRFVKNASFPIILGNPIRSHAVANYILSCIFKHYSTIPIHKTWDENRYWQRGLLKDKNVLIIGYGHIGKILEKALTPLVKKVHIYDPYKGKTNLPINSSDIVIPCANLNPSCYHMIDGAFLKKLPKNYLIINAARGDLIEQKALVKSLKENPRAFAFLDVFGEEPNSFEDFQSLKNIITTSHIAGVYKGLDNKILAFEKQVLTNFLTYNRNIDTFKNIYNDLLLQNRIHKNYLI